MITLDPNAATNAPAGYPYEAAWGLELRLPEMFYSGPAPEPLRETIIHQTRLESVSTPAPMFWPIFFPFHT